MVTIYDVAKYVGVSPTTVSSVLNDDPRVKESTRQRVKDAIRELGYVVNQNARGLAKRETKTLGIIAALDSKKVSPYETKNENGRFVHSVSDGIIDALAETGYSVLTERYSILDADGEVPQIVKSGRVDGLILIGGLFHEDLIDRIKAYGIPLVGICVSCDSIDTVNPDLTYGTYLAADELLKNGCRNVVLLNAPSIYSTSETRREGWNRALEKYPDADYSEFQVETITGGGGYLAMKTLWEKGIHPDGITTAGEAIALGAMRYLAEQGIQIPQNISVTAMGSSELSTYAIPQITAVDIYEEKVGAHAAQLLLKRLRKPDAPVEHRVVEVSLVPGASVRTPTEE